MDEQVEPDNRYTPDGAQLDALAADPLVHAEDLIARQAREIASLRSLLDAEFGQDLRDALALTAAAGAHTSPDTHSRLLEMIVHTVATVIPSRAASLFLIDDETHELFFEVALGQKAAEAKKLRVPPGHGIAGLVAKTGEPLIIPNAQQDPRHAIEIAQSIDYLPRNIVCVPLRFDNQVVGVLELLDREGAPAYDEGDLATLKLFADLAAVAIEQSRTQQRITSLVGEVLRWIEESSSSSA